MDKKQDHLFQKGESGNPSGRPRGAYGVPGKLRQAIQDRSGDIVQAMINNALNGDTAAQRALLDKIIPNVKSVAPNVSLDLGADKSLVQKAEKILHAVASGEVAPDVGAVLVQAVGGLAKIAEITELEQRLENLEKVMEAKK
ncbi:hypothetical protein MASR1M90_14520 [Desulfovibrionales bacterium]